MFDTTPKPWMLKGAKNEKWTASAALAEIIDNSFGPARGNGTMVDMKWDRARRVLEVLDDGRGMDNIGRLFQFGNTIGIAARDVGMYGSGGTKAILWMPRKVDVWTMRDGQVAHVSITWNDKIYKADHYPVVDNSWSRATLYNTPVKLFSLGHGTLIRMHIGKERAISSSNIRRDLGLVYAPALRQGKKLIWNDEPIAPAITFDALTQTVDFSLIVAVRDENDDIHDLAVNGAIGVIPDLPQSQSKIHIGYSYRTVLSTRDCFVSPDGSKRYAGVGVTGWLDLSDEWRDYLALTKDEMHNAEAWNTLMGHIFKQIEPLLKSLAEEKKYLVLDNIALLLQSTLNGDVEVDVPSEHRQPPDIPDAPSEPHPPNPNPNPKPVPGTNPDHDRKDKRSSKIGIVMLSDEDMESVLCRAETTPGPGIDVYVNGDHHIVQTALGKEPINQELLKVLVIQQVSAALIDEKEVAQQVLPKNVLITLEKKASEREKEQLLTRVLLDNTKGAA